jgi:hypothetical protein
MEEELSAPELWPLWSDELELLEPGAVELWAAEF